MSSQFESQSEKEVAEETEILVAKAESSDVKASYPEEPSSMDQLKSTEESPILISANDSQSVHNLDENRSIESGGLLYKQSTWLFGSVALVLLIATLGIYWLVVLLLCVVLFIIGGLSVLLVNGWERSEELLQEFDTLMEPSTSPGLPQFTKKGDKRTSKRAQMTERLTGSPVLDPILEEIVAFTLRDYVESWYSTLTTDELFIDSLRSTAYQTVAALSSRLRTVDWVPLVTQHVVDDFASHVRLYRKAKERLAAGRAASSTSSSASMSADDLNNGGHSDDGELESIFFDLEKEMEKSYCRDLISTSPHYENAYLHDLADILMYLLIPPEDFRSRPFRFLIREILVKKILQPLMAQLSDPDYINNTIVWLLSEVPITTDDFLCILDASDHVEEIVAIKDCLDEEIEQLRAKDTGENDIIIKQELSSLFFVKKVLEVRIRRLRNETDPENASGDCVNEVSKLDLPLNFVLANNISVSYFIDYLASVGGQHYIDLYLAIEGFKVSVEQILSNARLNRVTTGELAKATGGHFSDPERLETIREAAWSLYGQFLTEKAKEKVDIDQNILRQLAHRIKNEAPSDIWFEDVQNKVFETLNNDVRFYAGFRRNPLYFRMLAELDMNPAAQLGHLDVSQAEEAYDGVSIHSSGSADSAAFCVSEEEPIMLAHITTIGIGRDGNRAFALYSIQVTRQNDKGETLASWNVMRRYSDFFTLHLTVEKHFPTLSARLNFPSKKTFNNLNQEFLEKRKNALNTYLRGLLHPEIIKQNKGVEVLLRNFLCKKEYIPEKGVISKKVMSLVNPIRSGVKAFGVAVTAVPDTLAGGVSRMGDGIGKVTKTVLGDDVDSQVLFRSPAFFSTFLPDRWLENPLITPLLRGATAHSSHASHLYRLSVGAGPGAYAGKTPSEVGLTSPEGRVGAGIDSEGTDNIPLRILLLLMDEVFGLRQRNQWFRRNLVSFLRQLIHSVFGSGINRKIVDFVIWLTSEEQVAEYLKAFRPVIRRALPRALSTFWPNGQMTESVTERPHHIQMRARVIAKAKMLSALPDELRLFMGNETSRSGIQLVFEALQNPHLNKRLCYVLLERILLTVFPSNRFDKILPKLHSKSPRCQTTGGSF